MGALFKELPRSLLSVNWMCPTLPVALKMSITMRQNFVWYVLLNGEKCVIFKSRNNLKLISFQISGHWYNYFRSIHLMELFEKDFGKDKIFGKIWRNKIEIYSKSWTYIMKFLSEKPLGSSALNIMYLNVFESQSWYWYSVINTRTPEILLCFKCFTDGPYSAEPFFLWDHFKAISKSCTSMVINIFLYLIPYCRLMT